MCIEKGDVRSYVAYTSLKTSKKNDWYFNSGCSRHMTREKNFLKSIQSCSTRHVTFRDKVKGKVLRRGQLYVPRMPKLKDVSFVEGLKANLTSISQLCDDGLFMNFTREKCMVMNLSNQCVMEGTRSSDN